jgi:hypothetical protein
VTVSIPLRILFLLSVPAMAQSDRFYTTSGGEWIFSFADLSINDEQQGSVLRWSPVFNLHTYVHRDFSDNFGVYSGLGFRNVGFIADIPGTDGIRKKFRTYNVGIPIGIKIGRMNSSFFHFGYEFEVPFNYKEKTFENERKTDKFNVWFSGRTPTFYHSLHAGIQFYRGANLVFRYYLTNFFNKGFTETVDGVRTQPYENFDANVFYFGLSFNLMKDRSFIY